MAPTGDTDGGTITLSDDSHPDVQTYRFAAATSDSRKFHRIRVLQ